MVKARKPGYNLFSVRPLLWNFGDIVLIHYPRNLESMNETALYFSHYNNNRDCSSNAYYVPSTELGFSFQILTKQHFTHKNLMRNAA